MLKCSVVIPPCIKPYIPSYTAGILADIIRGCGSKVDIIDFNLLFLNHIYKNSLTLLANGEEHNIYSPDLETSLNKIKNTNIEVLTKEEYDRLVSEIKLRNLFLNLHMPKLYYSLFDIRIKQQYSLEELLCDNDLNGLFLNILAESFPKINVDIIFISVMSKEQMYFSILLAKYLHRQNSNCSIALGGPYLTAINSDKYNAFLNYFDCLCLGDAELVIPDLINNFTEKRKFISDYGAIFFENKRVTKTRIQYAKVEDVTKYRFHISDFESYAYFYPIKKYPILISRECCYGKCAFCTNKGLSKHGCRIIHIKDITYYIKTVSELGYSFVEFLDDNIHANYLKLLSDQIITNNININWVANSRFYDQFLNQEVCNQLYSSGCRKLFMGLESYNQDVINSMNKGIVLSNVIQILKNIKNAGIHTHISILFGFPGETFEQAQDTYRFLNENIHLLDLVEINRFVNYTFDEMPESTYDVDSVVKEARRMIDSYNKTPTYYQVYQLLKEGN